jgi:hypothetical protein
MNGFCLCRKGAGRSRAVVGWGGAAGACRGVIGADDYVRLFGAAPDVPVLIAVPEYENDFYANMIV